MLNCVNSLRRSICIALLIGLTGASADSGLGAEPGAQPALAPGVLSIVDAHPEEAETVTGPMELLSVMRGVQQWTPTSAASSETLASLAGNTTLRRPVWQLEFSYKPMRLIKYQGVDANGQPQDRAVWYLVYRLRNLGRHLLPKSSPDQFGHDEYSLKEVNHSVRFFPTFVLRDHEHKKTHKDRILPSIVAQIHAIEIKDPRIRLRDSVEISEAPIEISTKATDRPVWGVATWDSVDGTTDYFSVFVQGLSNSYQIMTASDGTQSLVYKTLQMNFWRPGDNQHPHVNEFRVGLPATEAKASPEMLSLYRMTEPASFRWLYLP